MRILAATFSISKLHPYTLVVRNRVKDWVENWVTLERGNRQLWVGRVRGGELI